MQDIPPAHLFPDKFPYLVVAILYEVEVDAHQSLDMVFVVVAHRHLELFEFGDDAALREVDVTLDEAVGDISPFPRDGLSPAMGSVHSGSVNTASGIR